MEQRKVFFRRMLSLAAAMLFTLTISAQSTISGHVKDDTGEDIIGASVVVKGTQGGTVTDFDGNFKVQCKPGTTLVITYVGFVPQEVKAQDGMDITLKEDVAQLNEVVVVGYGSLAKKEISSSVVQINKDQFNQGAASDPMALVAGKVAGLNVSTSADANPNAMTDIQVRGAGSLSASNGPLVVIDGIAGGDLRNIATQDVESITVLKDAGSAAIYGTRGANGVILVTTKKGSGTAGVTNVTYDSYIALNFQKGKPDILSTDEYRRSRRGPDYGADTDWWKEITRSASYNLNQYISIDSSTKNGYFGASVNYKKGNGLDIVSNREEYGGRFVMEQRVLQNYVQFNASLSGRKVHEEWGNDGLFDTALTTNPTIPVKNADGSYFQASSPTGVHNPVNDLRENVSQGDRIYLLGNADVKVNILQLEQHNLNTSLSYALQYNDLKDNFYTPTKSSESYWNGYAGRARINYQKWWTNRLEWLVNYTMTMGKHQLKAVLGYSWERNKWEQSGNENMGFVYDALSYHGIGSGSYLKDGKANLWAGSSESTLIGFFGRLNYNYNDIIFASASMRREGSTKFGTNTKWGSFPSGSLAWEITNTPFAESVGAFFQSLKPRVSYGVTGRSDFDAYKSLATYSTYSSYYIDNQWLNGYAPSLNANPDLAWEKSTAFNVGIDFVALNSRLRGSVEYFDRRSKDLLYNYTAPQPPFIYNTILVNVGTTKNTGLEVSIDYDVLAKKDLKWTTGINWSTGDTKLTKLSSDVYQMAYLNLYQKPGPGSSEFFFRVEEGGKIGQFYGYEHAGVDENGGLLVYDNDGNAQAAASADPAWKRNIGNGAPKHFLSWTNSFRYKNWDLSTLFRGAFGHKIFNMRKYGMGLRGAGTENVLRTAYTDDADVFSSGGIITSYFLENGNYFKLDNVTVGYSFVPKKRELIESLRVYLTAKNLFTLTAYKGNDPSIVTSTGITPGIDSNSAYPQATNFTLGVTVRFH
ncbi:TonB-linked outer membrane protein, SusC/RagA family [Prevotella sp. tc2-28]|uniref:SusC/RagA family TonB-linked outer membrane protein n=1 Tax=Prevotella sp. tc2-28 TaxID=1761888 RepID=UPI000895DA64|nr:SusC/RagA family TonB-linked outer membrane protein [Prevotella sp. tc2-28]SEA53648.1 TonB-linked outer membrane protein, SusC/RagA family [Prevotella sp. tc2-28]